MKNIITKYKLEFIGITFGSIAGWCYWYFVGCASGTCPITSNPINSTVYGMLLGGLTLGLFRKENNKQSQK